MNLCKFWPAIYLTILMSFVLTSCTDHCDEMRKKICECKENKQEQINCKQEAELIGKNTDKNKKQDICMSVIEKCSCEKLKNPTKQNLIDCGLTYE